MQFKTIIAAVAATASLTSASGLNLHPIEARQTNGPAMPSYLSDLPSIPISVALQLATAVPTSVITNPDAICSAYNGQKPAWFTSLPSSAQSVLTSYGSAIQSWASKHSAELASVTATAQITGLCAKPGSKASGNAAAARPTGVMAAGMLGAAGAIGFAML